jgi:hypothetical protein
MVAKKSVRRATATQKAAKKTTTEKASFMNGEPEGSTLSNTNKIIAGQVITSNITSYIMERSDFSKLTDTQVFEQMYKLEADIGAGIDRVSTLVSESFRGVVAKNVGEELDEKEEKCIKDAKKIYESMRVENIAEAYSEVIMTHGNLLIDYRNPLAPSILPNTLVTFIPDLKYRNSASIEIFTDPQYLVVNEQLKPTTASYLIEKGKYIHIKYKDTPISFVDNLNRTTYGIYSVSPLHRCIVPVWWKRQITMIDILLRAKMIPREHHAIQADIFSLEGYSGTPAEQRARQEADVALFISNYINTIKNQATDQGYVTLDTVDIKTVGGDSKYLQSNELLKQLQSDIYTGLNVPASIVNGKDAGSYASELVISNYVSAKVIQLAKKIRFVVLGMIRDRLLLIDPTYPVDIVDIKLELSLAMNKLEAFRQLSLMVAAGVFTEEEIRGIVGYEMLTDEQKKNIVSSGRIVIGDPGAEPKEPEAPTAPGEKIGVTAQNVAANASRGGGGEDAAYPDTDESAGSHTRDASENVLRK